MAAGRGFRFAPGDVPAIGICPARVLAMSALGLSLLTYVAAALAEIAGCFAFWTWLRSGRSVWWLLPGTLSLVLFAYLLTRIDVSLAGRAFAAYGGIYIIMSLVWLWAVEGRVPSLWDLAGAGLCLLGAGLILMGALDGSG